MDEQHDGSTAPLGPVPPGEGTGGNAATPTAPSARAPRWLAVVAVSALVLSLLSAAGIAAAFAGRDRLGPGRFAMAGAMMDEVRGPGHGMLGRGDGHGGRAGHHSGDGPMGWRGDGRDERVHDRARLRLERRGERREALADELGVTVEELDAAIAAVRADLDGLRDEAMARAPEERRAFVRDRVLDALATELGVTRADLDAAIAATIVDVLGGGTDDPDETDESDDDGSDADGSDDDGSDADDDLQDDTAATAASTAPSGT